MARNEFFRPAFDTLATDGLIGDPHGMLAYAYIRVSGDDQADEGRSGLPRQIAHIHEIAKTRGYKIPWDYVFAEDFTGFQFEDRPALTRLRETYKSPHRQANAVIFEHIDRLSRNADWHQGYLLDEMRRYGLEVIFWREYSSLIERAVLGAVAQEGMEQAKQRMMQGNLHKARSGRVTARVAAYGYKLVDSEGREGANAKKDSYYALFDEEASIILFIFERVASGDTLRELTTTLTEMGIPPPKQYAFWETTQLRLFIRNEVYKGDFYAHRWNHTTVEKPAKNGIGTRKVKVKVERPRDEWIHVPVPPIVTPELWEAANRVLDQNRVTSRRNARFPFLLTGLVVCADCGSKYSGSSKRKSKGKLLKTPYRYYRCLRRTARPRHVLKAQTCTNSSIPVDRLERAVWNVICTALLQPEVLISALENGPTSEHNRQLGEQITYLEDELARKSSDDDKMLKAYLAGAFDEQEFASRRKILKSERDTMREALDKLRRQLVKPEQIEARKAEILALAEHVKALEMPVNPPRNLKKRIVKMLIDRVVLDVKKGEFCLEGAIRGVFPIVSTPAHRVTHNLQFAITYSLTDNTIVSVAITAL